MSPWSAEVRAQLRLSLPVIVTNLGLFAMGVVDALIVGRVSVDAFAAVSLGHALLWVPMSFGVGMAMVLDPLVSQAHGAGDERGVARALWRGAAAMLITSVPIMAVCWASGPLLTLLRQPPEVIPDAATYVRLTSLGTPFLLLFAVVRQSLQATGRVRPVVITVIAANLVNLAADLVLIHGLGPVPPLGVAGCAWATVVCNIAMAGLLFVCARPALGAALAGPGDALQLAPLLSLLRMGATIGLTVVVEVSAFQATSFLMGWFGQLELAAHRAALMLASITFMVPLGMSAAASVRVGQAIGRGDHPGMVRATWVSLAGGAGFMLLAAVLFLAAPRPLCSVFFVGDGEQALAVAATLLPLAGVFQLFDGLQIVATGVLRGTGETRWPLVVNLVGYWVVGLPFGAWWAHRAGGGPRALWWGLVAGLFVVACVLVLKVRARMARALERVVLRGDEDPRTPRPPHPSSA